MDDYEVPRTRRNRTAPLEVAVNEVETLIENFLRKFSKIKLDKLSQVEYDHIKFTTGNEFTILETKVKNLLEALHTAGHSAKQREVQQNFARCQLAFWQLTKNDTNVQQSSCPVSLGAGAKSDNSRSLIEQQSTFEKSFNSDNQRSDPGFLSNKTFSIRSQNEEVHSAVGKPNSGDHFDQHSRPHSESCYQIVNDVPLVSEAVHSIRKAQSDIDLLKTQAANTSDKKLKSKLNAWISHLSAIEGTMKGIQELVASTGNPPPEEDQLSLGEDHESFSQRIKKDDREYEIFHESMRSADALGRYEKPCLPNPQNEIIDNSAAIRNSPNQITSELYATAEITQPIFSPNERQKKFQEKLHNKGSPGFYENPILSPKTITEDNFVSFPCSSSQRTTEPFITGGASKPFLFPKERYRNDEAPGANNIASDDIEKEFDNLSIHSAMPKSTYSRRTKGIVDNRFGHEESPTFQTPMATSTSGRLPRRSSTHAFHTAEGGNDLHSDLDQFDTFSLHSHKSRSTHRSTSSQGSLLNSSLPPSNLPPDLETFSANYRSKYAGTNKHPLTSNSPHLSRDKVQPSQRVHYDPQSHKSPHSPPRMCATNSPHISRDNDQPSPKAHYDPQSHKSPHSPPRKCSTNSPHISRDNDQPSQRAHYDPQSHNPPHTAPRKLVDNSSKRPPHNYQILHPNFNADPFDLASIASSLPRHRKRSGQYQNIGDEKSSKYPENPNYHSSEPPSRKHQQPHYDNGDVKRQPRRHIRSRTPNSLDIIEEEEQVQTNVNEIPAITYSEEVRPGNSPYHQPQHRAAVPFGTVPFMGDPYFFHLAELRKAPAVPYKGEPEKFSRWFNPLIRKLDKIQADPNDQIEILEAHTAGEPQELIQKLSCSARTPADQMLNKIKAELKLRFGGETKRALGLHNELLKMEPITGDAISVARGLRKLSDACGAIGELMDENTELCGLDSSIGLAAIRNKLPLYLSRRWANAKYLFMQRNPQFAHPPFEIFCSFIKNESDALHVDLPPISEDSKKFPEPATKTQRKPLIPSRTMLTDRPTRKFFCIIHNQNNSHDTFRCQEFSNLDSGKRKDIILSNYLCQKCLRKHPTRECSWTVRCEICSSQNHSSVSHFHFPYYHNAPKKPQQITKESSEGNPVEPVNESKPAPLLCSISRAPSQTQDCSKTLLADVFDDKGISKRIYIILDDQSRESFISPSLLDYFKISGPREDYAITTLSSERYTFKGRLASGLKIRGVGENKIFSLPAMHENPMIPDNREEVPSPKAIASIPHLAKYSHLFNEKDTAAEVAILLGRNSGDLMYARTEQKKSPFVFYTPLGYAVVGSIQCHHVASDPIVLKTCSGHENSHFLIEPRFSQGEPFDVFKEYPDDEVTALSPKDRKFYQKIGEVSVTNTNNLQVSLPFSADEPYFQVDNRRATFLRQRNTLNRLKRDPEKLSKSIEAMQKNIDEAHVEEVPLAEVSYPQGRAWHLPVFPIWNELKRKLRLVFDSAAEFKGVSLNKSLLTGPNEVNPLRSILTRFREGPVGFVTDVNSMFHQFYVPPEERNFLRFYWWKSNLPSSPIIPYRARVHIFGNTSSPSIATFCLRKAAETDKDFEAPPNLANYVEVAQKFINDHFYIDDGLGVASNIEDGIKIVETARYLLGRYNIRLHKILSNKSELTRAFPESERSEDSLVDMNYSPNHRTLGLMWDTDEDVFRVNVRIDEKPFTRRGILSTINGVYDPIGFSAPCILKAKLFFRNMIQNNQTKGNIQWDKPLAEAEKAHWKAWLESLKGLEDLKIPRPFFCCSKDEITDISLHIFVDSSEGAIGVAAYLRTLMSDGQINVVFICGESKLTPKAATTIPRKELCACVQGTNVLTRISQELKNPINQIFLYSDSCIALSYIFNTKRRFKMYVQRRVDWILKSTNPSQWNFIKSKNNPADAGSRPSSAKSLPDSMWISGPEFLRHDPLPPKLHLPNSFQPEDLPEIIEETSLTFITKKSTGLFDRWMFEPTRWIKSWTRTKKLVQKVLDIARWWIDKARENLNKKKHAIIPARADIALFKDMQRVNYPGLLKFASPTEKERKLIALSPYVDSEGVVRVGGRLKLSSLPENLKHPILLPGSHPATTMYARYIHETTLHQGRYITMAAIRQQGIHIEKLSKFVANLVGSCVICRRLRSKIENPKMADLPEERTETGAPFTAVGIDVMGPWYVASGAVTRKNAAQKKIWALMVTCLASRGVHMEVLESMDSSTFINAMKRVIFIRGRINMIRSDRGTNFLGAKNQQESLNVLNSSQTAEAVKDLGITWIMNPPHASHWGGVFERKIGQIRRCLDSTMMHVKLRPLTLEELRTLLMEAAYIVNSTPLWATAADPNEPQPVTPNMLLTQKSNCYDVQQSMDKEDLISYGPKRWKKIKALGEIFWTKWRHLYLLNQQQRQKWTKSIDPIKKEDIVVVKDSSTARAYWPIGRVVKTFISHDGVTRKADIRLSRQNPKDKVRFLTRPVSQLVRILASSS